MWVDAGWWGDFGGAVGGGHDGPFAVVGQLVVEAAEQAAVGEVGGSVVGPGGDVVGFAPGGQAVPFATSILGVSARGS